MADHELQSFIDSCPLVDHHCHSLVPLPLTADDAVDFVLASLTEARGAARKDALHSIAVKRSIRELSHALGCEEATLHSIVAAHRELGDEEAARKLLGRSNIAALLVDDGLRLGGREFSLDWHRGVVPDVCRVLRIETLAEDILAQAPPSGAEWSLHSFREALLTAMDPPPPHVVALKSIAAYRCGLAIDPQVTEEQAEEGLRGTMAAWRAASSPSPPPHPRLTNSALISFCVVQAMAVAAKHCLPLQLHCGFGDRDLDLEEANPLRLRALLEANEPEVTDCSDTSGGDNRERTAGGWGVAVVLLHSCYPYMREAGYLASMYSKVYVDCGLVFGRLSRSAMEDCIAHVLELTPLSKVLLSTDAFGTPEAYFIGARWARQSLSIVLSKAVHCGDLSLLEAIKSAYSMLQGNACTLYRLSNVSSPISLPK